MSRDVLHEMLQLPVSSSYHNAIIVQIKQCRFLLSAGPMCTSSTMNAQIVLKQLQTVFTVINCCNLRPPRRFPLLRGLDVSDKLPPLSDSNRPFSLVSSHSKSIFPRPIHLCFGLHFPSPPLQTYTHHSFSHTFFLPSHDMCEPL